MVHHHRHTKLPCFSSTGLAVCGLMLWPLRVVANHNPIVSINSVYWLFRGAVQHDDPSPLAQTSHCTDSNSSTGPSPSPPKRSTTHLKLHHSLLKPRSTHRRLPTGLTSTPNLGPVRRLHLSLFLTILRRLLHRRISQPHSRYWYSIGLRYVLDGLRGRGVVGRDFVAVWVAGGIGAVEERCWRASLL